MKLLEKIYIVVPVVLFVSGIFVLNTALAATPIEFITQAPPLISITAVPNPLAMPESGQVDYDYTVSNQGVVPVNNITVTDSNCVNVVFVSGDQDGDTRLDTDETWNYHCSTTLAQTTTSTATASGQANSFTASDTSGATAFVGVPLPTPLIHILTVPNTFVLPLGGGAVTYSYSLTNPGPAPLSDVSVTDDKCSGLQGRVSGNSGDLNQNNLLEAGETWSFTCQTTLSQTTTNIGTASGSASGLTATDSSTATVAVSTSNLSSTNPGFPNTGPGLPNTGFPPRDGNIQRNIIILAAIFAALISLYIGRKKIV